MFADEDLVPLCAIQHFLFCPRQCALIHIEQVWAENLFTIEGEIFHKRAHSGTRESRPCRTAEFGMPVRSLELGVSGKTDSVEYGADGSVVVVEYKRGRPKSGGADEVQLCAQALCLEEMRGINIARGVLFYGKTRRRKVVELTQELRQRTRDAAASLHSFLDAGNTPRALYSSATCPRCSLLAFCMPRKLMKPLPVLTYLISAIR